MRGLFVPRLASHNLRKKPPMELRILAVLALTLGLLHPVTAKAITYTAFSNTSGIACQTGCPRASMEGLFEIEDIGTISSPAQILDYSLTLDAIGANNGGPFNFVTTLTPANSTIDIRGDYALTATGTELFMSFGSGGRFTIIDDNNNSFRWEFRSIGGESPIHRIGDLSSIEYAPGTNVLAGIASPPTSIPLPASISLFLTGLGALGASALAKRVRVTA